MNRYVTAKWNFHTNNSNGQRIQLSVITNLDILTDRVVANAVGPGHVGLVVGKLVRDTYTSGNGRTSTRYSVRLNDGTELDWERTRKDAIARAGNLAIERAKDA